MSLVMLAKLCVRHWLIGCLASMFVKTVKTDKHPVIEKKQSSPQSKKDM